MDPRSKSFAWLGVVASIVGILTFLVPAGLGRISDFFKKDFRLALWEVIILLGLALFAVGFLLNRATRRLLDRSDGIDRDLQACRKEKEAMAHELASFDRLELATLQSRSQRLLEYETLEQEIVGLLTSGREMTLYEIIAETSVSLEPDRMKRVTRALAALGDRIDGNDGKYRRSQRL